MKRYVILFFCFFLLLIMVTLIMNRTSEKFAVSTFNVFNEKTLEKKVVFLKTLHIKAASDDFIEIIEKNTGDYVEPGSVLLRMESKEEAYQLAKSKNEFAISLLNSGKAVQEEKQQAVDLAQDKLENTVIRSPIEGYVLSVPVSEKLYVSKGTILFEILPIDASAYIQMTSEEEKLLKKAEFIEIVLEPKNSKWLLEEIQITEQNNNRFLFLSVDIAEIAQDFINSLYCKLIITFIDSKASWIPVEFVTDNIVFLEDNQKKEIQILERENDLFLVNGLKDGDILIKKR